MSVRKSRSRWSIALLASGGLWAYPHPKVAAPAQPEPGVETVRLVLRPVSRLWLEGDSNLHKWSCDAAGIVPELRLQRENPQSPPTRVDLASLTVPVLQIECGNGKMNDNLRKALGATEHPRIVFEVTSGDFADTGVRGLIEVSAHGVLRVAGAERPLNLVVSGADTGDGGIRITGRVTIRMTDFGITPPTAMLGLLKTKDEVTIQFDLVADYVKLATAVA